MTGPAFSGAPVTTAATRPARDKPVCEAKTRADTACQRPAGWGTDHAGAGRCKLHGGSTPSGRKAAAREQAVELLGTLGVVADPAALPTLVVHAELELSAAKQLAAVRWLEQQVGNVPAAQVDGSPWPPMLRDARRDSDRLLVELAKLGLDARRVQLEERQVDVLERVVALAMHLLGQSVEQKAVKDAVVQAVRTIEGEAA